MTERAQADLDSLDLFVDNGRQYHSKLLTLAGWLRGQRIIVGRTTGWPPERRGLSALDNLADIVQANNQFVATIADQLRVEPDLTTIGNEAAAPHISSGRSAVGAFGHTEEPRSGREGCRLHAGSAWGVATTHLSCPDPGPGTLTEIFPIPPPIGDTEVHPVPPDLGVDTEIFPVLPPFDETEVFPAPDPTLVREVLGTPPAPDTGLLNLNTDELGPADDTGPLTPSQRTRLIEDWDIDPDAIEGGLDGLGKIVDDAALTHPGNTDGIGARGELEAIREAQAAGMRIERIPTSSTKTADYRIDGVLNEVKSREKSFDSTRHHDNFFEGKVKEAGEQIGKTERGVIQLRLRGEAAETVDTAQADAGLRKAGSSPRMWAVDRVTVYQADGTILTEWTREEDGTWHKSPTVDEQPTTPTNPRTVR